MCHTRLVFIVVLLFLSFTSIPSHSKVFKKGDISLYNDEKPYVDTIIKGLNKLAKEHPRCKKDIVWGGLSKRKTKQNGYPTFFAICGDTSVYFSEKDLGENKKIKSAKHISLKKAYELCRDVPKYFEEWKDYHHLYKKSNWESREHKNGRTTVVVRMYNKDYDINYHTSCLLDEKGLIEATIDVDYEGYGTLCKTCLRKTFRTP